MRRGMETESSVWGAGKRGFTRLASNCGLDTEDYRKEKLGRMPTPQGAGGRKE